MTAVDLVKVSASASVRAMTATALAGVVRPMVEKREISKVETSATLILLLN